MAEVKRVACLRTDRMGDLLLTMPAMAAIKERHPDCHLAVVCSPGTEELVKEEPWVDETYAWSRSEGVAALSSFLRKGGFDAAIFFYPRPLTALAAYLARVRIRIGTAFRWYSPLFNRRVRQRRSFNARHESEYGFELSGELGVAVPAAVKPVRPAIGNAASDSRLACLPERYTVVHPGCGGSALNARPAYYANVARAIETQGSPVVVTGTEGERDLMMETARGAGLPTSRCVFPPDLKTLANVLGGASGVVGPATGPIHLASALGRPVAALFAPLHSQQARRWGPLGERVTVLTPHAPLCPRCEGEACPLFNCLERIAPDDIVTSLREMSGR